MEVVILDFETTGLSCDRHRVIEIGAVILNDKGEILHTFQTLCNPPLVKPLPKIITKITGITESMLVGQQSTAMAMESLYVFIGNRPIIAHNATFDSKFLIAEMRRINKVVFNQFLCTLLLSRRLLQNAGCYKLSFLKKFINFQSAIDHKDHRALDDVLVTVALWNLLISLLSHLEGTTDEYAINLLATISRLSKKDVINFLEEKHNEIVGKGGGSTKRSRIHKDTAANEIKGASSVLPASETIQKYFVESIVPSVLPEDNRTVTEDYPPLDMNIIRLEFLVPELVTEAVLPATSVLLSENSLIIPSIPLEHDIASPVSVDQLHRSEKPMIRKVIKSSVTVATKKRRSMRHSNPF